jgi:enediyne biosynthesis protein E4
LDIVIFGYDTSVVYINDKGKFTEKILSLPPLHTFTYSPVLFNWADLNNDGYPDLVALQQASKYDSLGPDILPSYVFINDKNNDFRDESARMFPNGHTFRRARASQFGDFDNDGDQDLYIGNYFLEKDELYQNDGNGNFTDIAPDKNIDVTNTGSMHDCGVNWCDYDNDGDLDLISARIAHSRFVVQYDHRGTVLYRNEGAPDYNLTDLTGQYNDYPGLVSPIGLEYKDYHSSAAFADVNNDGLPDLLLKTYNPYRFISFYEQQPNHTFQMKRFEYGLDRIDAYGSGQVWMDYNNDGKIDLIMVNQNKISIFKNTINNGFNSVQFNLKCTSGNKYAIGARLTVYSGTQKFLREVSCGQDECAQFPYRQHIGLGNLITIDSVVVQWPTKPQKRDVYTNLNVDMIHTLTEGGGKSSMPLGVPADKKYSLITKTYPNPFSQISIINYELLVQE